MSQWPKNILRYDSSGVLLTAQHTHTHTPARIRPQAKAKTTHTKICVHFVEFISCAAIEVFRGLFCFRFSPLALRSTSFLPKMHSPSIWQRFVFVFYLRFRFLLRLLICLPFFPRSLRLQFAYSRADVLVYRFLFWLLQFRYTSNKA